MKNSKTYIPCVLLTIILVFSVLGTVISVTTDKVVLNSKTCVKIIDENKLSGKIKNLLEKNFTEKYNSTGIPAEVYTDILSEEYIDNIVKVNINSGFDYLNGNTDSFSVSYDFDALDKSISDFFDSYAEQNGYVKDSSYYDKLQKEMNNAHRIVTNYSDVFKLDSLNEHGVLSQARRYIGYLDKIMYICIGADIFCIVLLLLLCMKNIKSIFYWTGSGLMVSALIGLIPCMYLSSSKYFDSFVIKQEQIFTAFTSYMYRIVDTVTAFETGIFASGFILIFIYIITARKKGT